MNKTFFVEFWRDTCYQILIDAESEEEAEEKVMEKNYDIRELHPIQYDYECDIVQIVDMNEEVVDEQA